MSDEIKDGELIRPKMAADGGYHMQCCDCGLVHRLDFTMTEDDGLHLRVYRDEAKTALARGGSRDWWTPKMFKAHFNAKA